MLLQGAGGGKPGVQEEAASISAAGASSCATQQAAV